MPRRLPATLSVSDDRPVGIIAHSGRALAQHARMAHFAPFVLDLFGDQDTLRHAQQHKILTDWNAASIAQTLNQLDPTQSLPILYGAGCETLFDQLPHIIGARPLWGTKASAAAQICQPQTFFTILKKNSLPHPQTQFTPPHNNEQWLSKDRHKNGGMGIKWHQSCPASPSPHVYYQKFTQGRAVGLFFLATPQNIYAIGYSHIHTEQTDSLPMRLHRLTPLPDLPLSQCKKIEGFAHMLTCLFGLRGLCSLDVVIDGDDIFILEVNPRAGLALDLYHTDPPMLLLHRYACLERAIPPFIIKQNSSSVTILYAQKDMVMPPLAPSTHLRDVPFAGTCIKKNDPILTLCGQDKRHLDLLTKKLHG